MNVNEIGRYRIYKRHYVDAIVIRVNCNGSCAIGYAENYGCRFVTVKYIADAKWENFEGDKLDRTTILPYKRGDLVQYKDKSDSKRYQGYINAVYSYKTVELILCKEHDSQENWIDICPFMIRVEYNEISWIAHGYHATKEEKNKFGLLNESIIEKAEKEVHVPLKIEKEMPHVINEYNKIIKNEQGDVCLGNDKKYIINEKGIHRKHFGKYQTIDFKEIRRYAKDIPPFGINGQLIIFAGMVYYSITIFGVAGGRAFLSEFADWMNLDRNELENQMAIPILKGPVSTMNEISGKYPEVDYKYFIVQRLMFETECAVRKYGRRALVSDDKHKDSDIPFIDRKWSPIMSKKEKGIGFGIFLYIILAIIARCLYGNIEEYTMVVPYAGVGIFFILFFLTLVPPFFFTTTNGKIKIKDKKGTYLKRRKRMWILCGVYSVALSVLMFFFDFT